MSEVHTLSVGGEVIAVFHKMDDIVTEQEWHTLPRDAAEPGWAPPRRLPGLVYVNPVTLRNGIFYDGQWLQLTSSIPEDFTIVTSTQEDRPDTTITLKSAFISQFVGAMEIPGREGEAVVESITLEVSAVVYNEQQQEKKEA